MLLIAGLTAQDVATECISSAVLYGRHDLQLTQAEMATMNTSVPLAVSLKNVCHLKRWPRHLTRGGGRDVLDGVQRTHHLA